VEVKRWMSGEKAVEYDYGSCIAFVIGLELACGLMAGFAFTGTVVVLTSLGDPSTFLSQLSLVIMYFAVIIFLSALFELHFLNITVSIQSPKPIIPRSGPLAGWTVLNRNMFIGSFLVTASIPVMFLLRNLVLLFALSMSAAVLGNVRFYFRRWIPIRRAMEAKGIV